MTQIDISLIIKTLDAKKAHDCDNSSVKTTQVCGEFVALPLRLIFKTALKEKIPDIWEIANVLLVRKKDGKNLIKKLSSY